MAPSDEALIDAARAGDAGAFGDVVDRHRRSALRLAYVIAGDDAEDIVQDACIRAFRNLDQFSPGMPFRPWLLAIVANVARNHLRGHGRRERIALRVAERDPQGTTDSITPEEIAIAHQRRQELLDAVAGLDERDREIVALRYFVGLSEAETASTLDCPVGTAKSRLSRALARLRLSFELEAVR